MRKRGKGVTRRKMSANVRARSGQNEYPQRLRDFFTGFSVVAQVVASMIHDDSALTIQADHRGNFQRVCKCSRSVMSLRPITALQY